MRLSSKEIMQKFNLNGIQEVPYEGKHIVKKDGKFGHIDIEGNIITQIMYDSVGNFRNDKSWVKLNGVTARIDEHGNVIKGKYELIIGCFK